MFRTLIIVCVSTYLTPAFIVILVISFTASIAFLQPHICRKHSMISALFLLLLGLALLSLIPCLQINSKHLMTLINVIVFFVPILYIVVLVSYWMIGKMGIQHTILRKLRTLYRAPLEEDC